MANTTNFGWETPDDTDLVKDGASAMRTLGNAIDTSLVDLKGGTTGQVLSKASNTDMDFTWVAQDDSNAIQNAIVDAKGDLITATAADTPARLAVGSNDQVLMADSSTATGLKWGTPSSGGMTLISETVASSSTGISFTSISGSYKQLILVWSGIQHSTTGSGFCIRLNNNSNSIYYNIGEFKNPSGSTINQRTLTHIGANFGGQDIPAFGYSASFNSIEQNVYGYSIIDNYASSTKFKVINTKFAYYDNSLGDYSYANIMTTFGSTTAVTSLDIVRIISGSATMSNTANTTIRLYGVA